MIRDVTVDDLDYFVASAKDYLLESGEGEYLSFDETSFRQQCTALIENRSVISLIDGERRGHIVGVVLNSLWNPNEQIARVNTIWVNKDHRGTGLAKSLIRALESRLPAVKVVLIDSSEAMNPEAVGKFYQIQGYRPIQKLYAKVLNGH